MIDWDDTMDQETAEAITQLPHVKARNFSGKVMNAWATLEPLAITDDQQLKEYCEMAIDIIGQLPKKK